MDDQTNTKAVFCVQQNVWSAMQYKDKPIKQNGLLELQHKDNSTQPNGWSDLQHK